MSIEYGTIKIMKSRDGFAAAILVFVILALVVIGGIVYVHYVYLPKMASENTSTVSAVSTSSVSAPAVPVVATSTVAPTTVQNATPPATTNGTALSQNQAAFSCSYSDATSVGVILQASFPSYINTSNIEALSSDEDSPIISEDQAKGLFCIKVRKASVDTMSLADKKTGYQIWTTVVNPQKGQQYAIDANSTAIAVLFITPYFNNSNPANAEVILSAITKDPGIPALAQTIQSNPKFIDDFTSSSTQVGTLFQTVIQRVLSGLTATTQFTPSTPAIKINSPTGADTWSASAFTQYEITWIDQGLGAGDQEQLYLYFPNGTQCGFENGPVGTGGSGNAYVILPSMGCSGSIQKPVLAPGRYSIAIVVQDASGNVVAAGQSDWFNVTQ
jgi:hypothetical protein